jgi:hypothetical protein
MLREDGKLRLWFSSAHLFDPTGLHSLHETSSLDGASPSNALQNNVYAPSVVKDGPHCGIWYATRKAPPFVNKNFAIGTARWDAPRR